MSLTDYEKALVRTWSMDHAQRSHGAKKAVPVDTLINEAAKISGFIMGSSGAEIVAINEERKGAK